MVCFDSSFFFINIKISQLWESYSVLVTRLAV